MDHFLKRIILFLSLIIISINFYSLQVDSKFKMTLQTGNPGGVLKICFSNDGTMFATSNLMNKTIKIWNNKAKLLYTIDNGEDINNCEMAFSPDGKYLAYTNYTYAKIYNLTNRTMVTIKGASDLSYRIINGIVFSSDGKYVYTGSYYALTTTLPLEINKNEFENDLKKFDEENAGELKKFYTLNNNSQKYSLNIDMPDHSVLYSIFVKLKYDITQPILVYSNCIEQWDCNGNFIKKLGEHNNDQTKMITKMIISSDGKKILTAALDGLIKIWDVNTGLINTIQGSSDVYVNIRFSKDGKLFGWTSYSGFKVCNLNGVYLININRTVSGPSDIDIDKKMIVEFAYDTDSQKNIIPMLRLRGLNDEVKKDIKGISSTGYSIKLNPEGTLAVAGTLDGMVNIVNLGSESTISLICDKNEWLSFTPDGYWDSSKNGGKLVAMVQDLEAYSVDQFATKYNRPDIILKRLETENEDVINYYYYQYKKRLRKMNFKEEDLTNELHIPEAKIINTNTKGKFIDLEFSLSDTSYNLKSYNIYVNDVPIFGTYGKQIDGKNKNIKETIELSSGNNKIEISCLNEKGAESFRALTAASYDIKIKGDLYYLGFGVSKYKNQELNLQFADKDAKDLEIAFQKMKGYYNNIYTKSYTNENVVVDSIKKAKDLLKNAKVDDTFVLFIAGHGVHDKDKESTYYFLTYDTDIDNLSKNCADFDLIEDLLQGIPPRNKLFLMDTCESGEVDENVKITNDSMSGSRGIHSRSIKRGSNTSGIISKIIKNDFYFDNDRYINNNLTRRSGAIVFSACKGGEYSYESDEINNGFFTREILNTLSGINSAKAASGAISIDELRDVVAKSVSIKTSGLQNPTVDRDNIFIKFSFPLVK